MKILFLDIETGPATVYTFELHNVNIGLEQVLDPGRMLCFSYSWGGPTKCVAEWEVGHDVMVATAWDLLNEADVVVHYNGQSFDVPWIQREFFELGLGPTSPFAQVDLLLAVRKQFKFLSNKLAHVAEQAELSGKIDAGGFRLWRRVLTGDVEAQQTMEAYCIQDTVLLQELYEQLLPWLPNHPHLGLYDPDSGCPRCGNNHQPIQKRGFAYTATSRFQQYQCLACGSYFRDSKRLNGVRIQGVAR